MRDLRRRCEMPRWKRSTTRKTVLASKLFWGPLLCMLCSGVCVNAQVSDAAESKVDVGVFDLPCNHLPALPAVVQGFMSAAAEAKKAGKPAPVRTPEGMAIYTKWQQTTLTRDYGGNCKYQAANAALPSPSKNRLVFFGDSITETWGISKPELFGGQRINRGISGQTTSQMLIRFRQDVLDLKPGTVHILAGTNDIAGNTGPTSLARIEGNIASMVEQAQAHHIRVVLGSVLPAAAYPWQPSIMPIAQITAVNSWLIAYARQNHITYIDYYSRLVDDKDAFTKSLTVDGVHPNDAGYEVMTSIAKDELHLGDSSLR